MCCFVRKRARGSVSIVSRVSPAMVREISRAPPTPIGKRLLRGFLALFGVSAVAVVLALMAARDVNRAVRDVSRLAEEGRRIARVGGLVREYYIHQAHLALGMNRDEHLTQARRARASLEEVVSALAEINSPAHHHMTIEELRRRLGHLDASFESSFLPALEAGQHQRAVEIHHGAAYAVSQLVAALDADQTALVERITQAQMDADRQARMASIQAIGALIVAIALGVGVALWLNRGITVPVARLRAAANSLAAAAEGTRVPETGPSEVMALAATLNEMLEDLERQRRARFEAETLAALGRVAAGIAHEINNPLAVILGHARLIERQGGVPAQDAEIIAREAGICQSIVQSLLDYARPGTPTRRPVNLGELAALATERAGGAEVTIDDDLAVTIGDRRRLEQLVYNLVANARAFGDQVSVMVATDTPGVRLTVDDDGPGLVAEDVDRVFEPFYSTRADGTGLGLAIARSIAVAHGGTLTARPGPGGHFELWLPLEEQDGTHPGH